MTLSSLMIRHQPAAASRATGVSLVARRNGAINLPTQIAGEYPLALTGSGATPTIRAVSLALHSREGSAYIKRVLGQRVLIGRTFSPDNPRLRTARPYFSRGTVTWRNTAS
jgi:hypothetical protein